MALSGDAKTAACGGAGHKIIVWDLEQMCKECEILTPAVFIYDLEFSPDGKRLAASGVDNTIRIYAVETGDEIETIKFETRGRF